MSRPRARRQQAVAGGICMEDAHAHRRDEDRKVQVEGADEEQHEQDRDKIGAAADIVQAFDEVALAAGRPLTLPIRRCACHSVAIPSQRSKRSMHRTAPSSPNGAPSRSRPTSPLTNDDARLVKLRPMGGRFRASHRLEQICTQGPAVIGHGVGQKPLRISVSRLYASQLQRGGVPM